MIKTWFARLLALIVCLSLLSSAALAVGPSYTVESVSDQTPDSDILLLSPLSGNLHDLVGTGCFFSSYPSYSPRGSFGDCYRLMGTQQLGFYDSLFIRDLTFLDSFLDPFCFCLEFRLNLSELADTGKFFLRFSISGSTTGTSADILQLNKTNSSFLNSVDYISSAALSEAFFTESFVSVKIVCISQEISLFVDGHFLGSGTYSGPSISSIYFGSSLSYSYLEQVRISTGKYLSDLTDYIPATEPFQIPYIPVLPEPPVNNCVYVVSELPAGQLFLDTTMPADAIAGDVWLSLSADQTCTAVQIYDGSSWSAVTAAFYTDGSLFDVIGYQFDLGSPETPVDPDAPHDFLSTPFTAYTVTEGLLLALLLCVVSASILKLIKEGFYWLW